MEAILKYVGNSMRHVCAKTRVATEPYLQKRTMFLDSLEEAVGCDVSSEFKGRNCIFPLLMGR